MILYTIGHSSLAMERFLDLLSAHGVAHVIDVRRFPMSRRYPQFSREFLKRELGERRICYTWVEALGGRREYQPTTPHTGWNVEGFPAFADHMETEAFEKAMAGVLEIATKEPVALMCAEANVERCHRWLISDWLHVRGIEVRHISSSAPTTLHVFTDFARLEGTRIIYDGG